jgi:hypothetical protein
MHVLFLGVFCYLFICLNEVFTWDGEWRQHTHKDKINNFSFSILLQIGYYTIRRSTVFGEISIPCPIPQL